MEDGESEKTEKKWRMKGNKSLTTASGLTVREVLDMVMHNLNPHHPRQLIPLGHGDPSLFPSFFPSPSAENAIVDALRSRRFNCYSPTAGILPARRAVAEYLSHHLPYKLSPDDVFLTCGCAQAIEVALSSLVHPKANILLPRPGFPGYESRSAYLGLEIRHFDLISEKGWEIDLDAVEDLADDNTVAMVIINPGNPCGNVYTYKHLQQVAETAKKLGILVIADEVYEHLTFGKNPFIPMGVFGNIVPVITLGSISKRWIVPGWRLGWLVTNDTQGILQESGLVESIKGYLNISVDPATFIQGALPQILENTKEDFFSNVIDTLRQDAELCYQKLEEIPCITCPKANVVVLPGVAVGMKNWLRITFALEPSILEEGLERIKTFCARHAKQP